jgi:hypothetical protein
MRIKNIDDIVIFACQLWSKYDLNADLYLLQRKIWRDKKNINMTMNGGQIHISCKFGWLLFSDFREEDLNVKN